MMIVQIFNYDTCLLPGFAAVNVAVKAIKRAVIKKLRFILESTSALQLSNSENTILWKKNSNVIELEGCSKFPADAARRNR